MKLHRFYSPTKIDNEMGKNVAVSTTYTDVSQQWQKVLRFTRGEQVILFDGSGYDFLCEIKDYQGQTVLLNIIEKKKNDVLPVREVVLCMSLVKKDIFEWIAQKATELGVSDIIPIIAERSEKKNLNTERLQKIIIEAAEQSGRSSLPVLHEICELDEVLGDSEKIWGNDSTLLVFDITAEKFSIEDVRHTQKIVVFIGPEGGWTPAEIETFKNTDIAIRSLGPQVLRAETAVVAALAQLVF